nr:spermatogenesis-associated protein 31E1-like [Microcebus murinus]
MENNLLPLKSISPPWMGTRCTSLVSNIFPVFIFGMGLFLLFILCRQSNPSSPRPGQQRSIRKLLISSMQRLPEGTAGRSGPDFASAEVLTKRTMAILNTWSLKSHQSNPPEVPCS